MSLSKILVPLIIVANILFTWQILELFKLGYGEPSSLIYAWFAFTTGELFAMAKIRSDKVKVEGTESKYMSTSEMGDYDGEN